MVELVLPRLRSAMLKLRLPALGKEIPTGPVKLQG
jgi:hypothetical protein